MFVVLLNNFSISIFTRSIVVGQGLAAGPAGRAPLRPRHLCLPCAACLPAALSLELLANFLCGAAAVVHRGQAPLFHREAKRGVAAAGGLVRSTRPPASPQFCFPALPDQDLFAGDSRERRQRRRRRRNWKRCLRRKILVRYLRRLRFCLCLWCRNRRRWKVGVNASYRNRWKVDAVVPTVAGPAFVILGRGG